MDVKIGISIFLNKAPPQKLFLAPGAIIRGNTVLIFQIVDVLGVGAPYEVITPLSEILDPPLNVKIIVMETCQYQGRFNILLIIRLVWIAVHVIGGSRGPCPAHAP